MPAETATVQATNLFLLEDLEDARRTSELARSDLDAFNRRGLDQVFHRQAERRARPRRAGLSLRACVVGAQDALARP